MALPSVEQDPCERFRLPGTEKLQGVLGLYSVCPTTTWKVFILGSIKAWTVAGMEV